MEVTGIEPATQGLKVPCASVAPHFQNYAEDGIMIRGVDFFGFNR